MSMNVYTKMGYWSTAVTLIVGAAVLCLDCWMMSLLPILRHGLPYLALQAAMVWLLMAILKLILVGDRAKSKVD